MASLALPQLAIGMDRWALVGVEQEILVLSRGNGQNLLLLQTLPSMDQAHGAELGVESATS